MKRTSVYSQHVTKLEQSSLEQRLGTRLVRYDPDYCWAVESRLAALMSPRGLLRSPTREESDFIKNERLLCALDFHYWSERYAWLLPGAAVGEGGILRFCARDSQR